MRRQYREADALVDVVVLVEDRRTEPAELKPAAALPADRLRNAALLAVHNLLQPRYAIRYCMFTQLDPDPPPPHLVRHRCRRARTKKRVEHQVAGISGEIGRA